MATRPQMKERVQSKPWDGRNGTRGAQIFRSYPTDHKSEPLPSLLWYRVALFTHTHYYPTTRTRAQDTYVRVSCITSRHTNHSLSKRVFTSYSTLCMAKGHCAPYGSNCSSPILPSKSIRYKQPLLVNLTQTTIGQSDPNNH